MPLSATAVAAEVSTLEQDVDATVEITWASALTAVGSGLLTFLENINPINSASAATLPPSPGGSPPSIAAFNQAESQDPAAAKSLFESSLHIGPQYVNFHEYSVSGNVGYTSLQDAKSFVSMYAAGALLNSTAGAKSGDSVYLGPAGLPNPIEIFIDQANNITWNVTLKGHLFYPGIVERTIEQRTDGLFYVNSYGEGNGAYPQLNDEAAGIIFSGHTTVLH